MDLEQIKRLAGGKWEQLTKNRDAMMVFFALAVEGRAVPEYELGMFDLKGARFHRAVGRLEGMGLLEVNDKPPTTYSLNVSR